MAGPVCTRAESVGAGPVLAGLGFVASTTVLPAAVPAACCPVVATAFYVGPCALVPLVGLLAAVVPVVGLPFRLPAAADTDAVFAPGLTTVPEVAAFGSTIGLSG